MVNWTVEQKNDATFIRFDLPKTTDEFWVLVRSDAHHDAPTNFWKKEKEHLDLAKERNAAVLDFGDMFDVMNLPGDPRASRGGIKAEHAMRDSIVNSVMDSAAEAYAPYAKNFALLARGNHEETVIKHNGFDCTQELVRRLKSEHGAQCVHTPQTGFIRFHATMSKNKRQSMVAYYSHGGGGYAPVTHGTIRQARRSAILSGCDFVFTGHVHTSNYDTRTQHGVNTHGTEFIKIMHMLQISGYKRSDRWAKNKEFEPFAPGCAWLRFYYNRQGRNKISLKCQVMADFGF